MQLLDCIETQLVCNRLPLVGVTVAAVPLVTATACFTPVVRASSSSKRSTNFPA